MPFAIRHRDDPTPALSPIEGMSIRRELDAGAMATLQNRSVEEISSRFAAGHRAYVAIINGHAAAWGWVATSTADIGELGAHLTLSSEERYLWNFVTLPAYRGLGIYPRLLQAIVRAESADVERFWIGYAPENHASGAGIRKAGFVTAVEMSFDANSQPALRAELPTEAAAASRVLGLPITSEPLSPCWRCVRAGRSGMSCSEGSCQCDYQEPKSGCAA
ncbi:MAG TPA: GNAT family N-acetyltransferase [Gemmatimonadaceae bacterium]|nr:GNAT family N-acetyltransferase [Gemmatimonadaceae bacterium]